MNNIFLCCENEVYYINYINTNLEYVYLPHGWERKYLIKK